MNKRAHQRRVCGFCGKEVSINKDKRMRIHGPGRHRCTGSGVKWTPSYYASPRVNGTARVWGTCGICGDVTIYDETSDAEERTFHEEYFKKHDHTRPRVSKQDGAWMLHMISHRTGKETTLEFVTHEGAMKAVQSMHEIGHVG